MVYILIGIIFIVLVYILFLLFDIDYRTKTTRSIVLNWATYYVVEEYNKGNNKPLYLIFPDDREKMEKLINEK